MRFLCGFIFLVILSVVNSSPVVYGKNAILLSKYSFFARLSVQITAKKKGTNIELNRTYRCGGTIIGKRTVLTAAHCVWGKVKSITVHVGTLYMNTPTQSLGWQGVKRHPKYNRDTDYADLAIVWVVKDFVLQPAVLASKQPEVDTEVSYVGFGITERVENPDRLQEGVGKILSKRECPDIGDICVRGKNKIMNPCVGDSGGPLVSGEIVVGVVSVLSYDDTEKDAPMYEKCNGRSPAIFVDISLFLDWINENKNKRTKP